MNPNWLRLLLLLIPILLIQLGLIIFALIDLAQRKSVRGPRSLWLALLIVTAFAFPTGIVVAGVYLAWARQGEDEDEDAELTAAGATDDTH